MRIYMVWLRGKRVSTERRYVAETKDAAIWKAHYDFGVRTIDLDAQWMRNEII